VEGWQAIRRYVNIVLSRQTCVAITNTRADIIGDTASAVCDTKIGVTMRKDNDKVTFRKIMVSEDHQFDIRRGAKIVRI
jgi:hypothetical protein